MRVGGGYEARYAPPKSMAQLSKSGEHTRRIARHFISGTTNTERPVLPNLTIPTEVRAPVGEYVPRCTAT